MHVTTPGELSNNISANGVKYKCEILRDEQATLANGFEFHGHLITFHCGRIHPFVPCYAHYVSVVCCTSSFRIHDCSQVHAS